MKFDFEYEKVYNAIQGRAKQVARAVVLGVIMPKGDWNFVIEQALIDHMVSYLTKTRKENSVGYKRGLKNVTDFMMQDDVSPEIAIVMMVKILAVCPRDYKKWFYDTEEFKTFYNKFGNILKDHVKGLK